ncbi:hypothetical protein ES706_04152 [subsurface metagenome]
MNQKSTEEEKIINKLTSKMKKIISQFDPNLDSDRSIPSQELELRVTKGCSAVCSRTTLFNSLPKLTELNLISKVEELSSYRVTRLGWRIMENIIKSYLKNIPSYVEEQMDLLIRRINQALPFSQNIAALKTWAESFSLSLKDISEVFTKLGKDSQRQIVIALGLVTWNQFLQPLLIKNKEFVKTIKLDVQLDHNHINIICKYFGWEYYAFEDSLWFICKEYNFWRQRYKDLYRYYMTTLPAEWIMKKKSRKIKKQTIEILKGVSPGYEIHDKAISRLAEEILFQKGHDWTDEYQNNSKWIIPRLEVILLKSKK